MKPRPSNQTNQALTLVEVIVVIAVLVFLAAAFFPAYSPRKPVDCVNNLHQIGIGFRVWAGDNNDKYPMEISVTNGGTMELAATGDVVATFQIMSNELSTPKVLLCPADTRRVWATNFSTDFNNSHISYFVGLDTVNSNAFLSGDGNFLFNRIPVRPGLAQLSTNAFIAWSSGRHVSPNSHFWTAARDRFIGNILCDDGSVQQTTSSNLCQLFQQTGLATNRLAIP
ncbi:MAG: type II secretion system protein [Verrucomicrobiota bacterium]|jgi:hypothetical protein